MRRYQFSVAACWARVSMLALVAILTMSASVHAQEPATDEGEGAVVTAPVTLDGTVLFRVRGVSSLPAAARARLIMDRLTTLAADPAVAVESLRTAERDGATHVLAGDVTIMTIVDADASIEQVRRADLGVTHLGSIRQAILAYRAARTPDARRQGMVTALVATLVVVASIVLVLWLWRRLDQMLTRRLRGRIHTVGIQSFELMRGEQIWTALRSATLVLRTIVLLTITLVYLGFILAQFPNTRGLSLNMTAFALAPLRVMASGFVANIPSLVFLTVLFFVVRLVLRLVRLFFEAVGAGTVTLASFFPDWAEPTYKIVRFAIVAFALIVAYPYIPGSDSDAFRGVSLFIGIVFSLGSSSAIANILAGYMMTYRRALKVGERVKIGDVVGDVIETRLQVTHLRSFKNEEIIIPNSQILNAEVLNYSTLAPVHGLILHTEVGIGYETPWRQVEAMLLAAADRTTGLAPEPRPYVLEKRLGDFAVTYELNAYCRDAKAMVSLYSALHRNILDVFNEYGVQIMTPAYEGDPPEPKIVAKDQWYAPPAMPPGRPQADAIGLPEAAQQRPVAAEPGTAVTGR